MPTFSDTELTELLNEAETELSIRIPCIIERLALSITSGIASYTLPSYIIDIRKVMWKGIPLYPFRTAEAIDNNSAVFQVINGQPREYLYDNLGQNTIYLYPTPNETISSITTNLFGTEILNRCIVEFYRKPDFNTTNQRFPIWLRRRTTKGFVLQRCFAREGIEQDIKASEYWKNQYETQVMLSKRIYETIFISHRKEFGEQYQQRTTKIGRPILPSKYWTI